MRRTIFKNKHRKEIFYEQKAKEHYDYPHFSYTAWRTGSTFLSAGHNTSALWSNRRRQHRRQILPTDFCTYSGYSVLGNLPQNEIMRRNTMQAVLEIKNFTKEYAQGKKAVDNLSLSVMPGEIHGFIGHNGAGKTTTLRAVVGVMGFNTGEILIDGHSAKNEPVKCKLLTAYIPDNPDLYDYITGIQYMNCTADMFSVDRKHREERIKEYAELLYMNRSCLYWTNPLWGLTPKQPFI